MPCALACPPCSLCPIGPNHRFGLPTYIYAAMQQSTSGSKRRRKLDLIGIKGISLKGLCKVVHELAKDPVVPIQQPYLLRLSCAEYQKVEPCYKPDVAIVTFVRSSSACRRRALFILFCISTPHKSQDCNVWFVAWFLHRWASLLLFHGKAAPSLGM